MHTEPHRTHHNTRLIILIRCTSSIGHHLCITSLKMADRQLEPSSRDHHSTAVCSISNVSKHAKTWWSHRTVITLCTFNRKCKISVCYLVSIIIQISFVILQHNCTPYGWVASHLLVLHQCLCQLDCSCITNIVPPYGQRGEATTTSQQTSEVGSAILPPAHSKEATGQRISGSSSASDWGPLSWCFWWSQLQSLSRCCPQTGSCHPRLKGMSLGKEAAYCSGSSWIHRIGFVCWTPDSTWSARPPKCLQRFPVVSSAGFSPCEKRAYRRSHYTRSAQASVPGWSCYERDSCRGLPVRSAEGRSRRTHPQATRLQELSFSCLGTLRHVPCCGWSKLQATLPTG